jgi:hypothetical protein
VTRELEIEVDPASVERARADVAAVALFCDERPLRGGVGRADWRLCGKLSQLVASGRLAGEPGEAALVATFGGLHVPLLLVLGAGPRREFDVRRFGALTRDAVARALALRARSLALPFPEDATSGVAHERRVAALVSGAAEAVAAAPAPLELQLRLLVPREDVTRAADLLRRASAARIPESVALRLPSTRPRQAPARAPAPPPSAGSQFVK